ncbi:MAG: septum formation initiator family protein [Gammaproteobacteria bacterium]|nr:septum formation initiator family protein [Gammaproteobacteria bacterium]
MRIAAYLLAGLLLVLLQYTLWFGTGGAVSLWRLKHEIAIQKAQNARVNERDQALDAKVLDLRQGLASVQDLARSQLGMVKKNETFYQVIQQDGEGSGASRR